MKHVNCLPPTDGDGWDEFYDKPLDIYGDCIFRNSKKFPIKDVIEIFHMTEKDSVDVGWTVKWNIINSGELRHVKYTFHLKGVEGRSSRIAILVRPDYSATCILCLYDDNGVERLHLMEHKTREFLNDYN